MLAISSVRLEIGVLITAQNPAVTSIGMELLLWGTTG